VMPFVEAPGGALVHFVGLDLRSEALHEAIAEPVVPIHGLGCDWRHRSRQIAWLAHCRRVIALDAHGGVSKTAGPPGMVDGRHDRRHSRRDRAPEGCAARPGWDQRGRRQAKATAACGWPPTLAPALADGDPGDVVHHLRGVAGQLGLLVRAGWRSARRGKAVSGPLGPRRRDHRR
jgi:hypothetical protein